MIFVTRLDGRGLVVNADLVSSVESIPDTAVTLTTGHRVLVKESVEEVVRRTLAYRQDILRGALVAMGGKVAAMTDASGIGER